MWWVGPDSTLQEAVIGSRRQLADKAHCAEGVIVGDDLRIGHARAIQL